MTRWAIAALLACALHAADLPIRVYNTADGLAYNRVARVYSDSHGFLWFCTEDGLSRFDGNHFVNFRAEQGLPYPVVDDLVEAPGGIYWIATNGGGMARLDTASDTAHRILTFPVSGEAATNRVNMLFRSRSGLVWLGTDGGVFTLRETNGKVDIRRVPLDLPSHPDLLVQVWAITEDAEGSTWIGTRFGLIRLLPDGRLVHYPVQPGSNQDHVLSLRLDRSGALWVGHLSGLFVLRPRSTRDYPAEAGQHVMEEDTLVRARLSSRTPISRTLGGQEWKLPADAGKASFLNLGDAAHPAKVQGFHEHSDGRMWIVVFPVGLFEAANGHIRAIDNDRSLMQDLIGSMTEDRDSNIWLATVTHGAIRVSPQGLVNYGEEEGLNGLITGLLTDDQGRLVVTLRNFRIACFEGGRFSTYTLGISGDTGWETDQALLRDHLGEWWAGTRSGLYRFAKVDHPSKLASARPKAIYTTRDGLAENQVTRVFEDSRGDVWFSSFAPAHDVLTRWNRAAGTFRRFSDRDGLPPFSQPTVLLQNSRGDMWVGFREGGIARYNNSRFQYFGAAEGMPEGAIVNCLFDRSDALWCSNARQGLIRIHWNGGPHIDATTYSTRQGFASNMVTAVGEDIEGRLYAGSLRGIDQFDPRSNRVRHFDAKDGLPVGRVIQAYRDAAGSLWFSHVRGLSRLVEGVPRATLSAPVLISDLRISGVQAPISPLGAPQLMLADLPSDRNAFQIDYLRLSLAPGDPPLFQYKLEGADTTWSNPTLLQTVNYPRLPPGHYRFLVRSVGPDGAAAGDPASVTFRIVPPLWERWWALASLAAIVLGSAAWFERFRTDRLRELRAALAESDVLTQALRESEAKFRALAETASDALITTGEDGAIVYVNPAAERVFGRSTTEMIGASAASLIPDYAAQLHRDDPAHNRWQAVEMRGLHAEPGRELTLEVSFAEFTREGRRFFSAVARDTTERKQAEEALRRSREERIAELERVRRTIATDLHDDLGSSLTQIAVFSEVVQQHLGQPDAAISGPLAYIARASRDLMESMTDIVWAINPQRDRLSDLVHRMRRFGADTLSARNIGFRLDLPSSENEMRLEGNLRREVFLIYKESINNLVRHSACSEAEIRMSIAGRQLELTVRDNGCGFELPGDGDGHGLASMRHRAANLGARFDLTSAPGRGTMIAVRIPLDYTNS